MFRVYPAGLTLKKGSVWLEGEGLRFGDLNPKR